MLRTSTIVINQSIAGNPSRDNGGIFTLKEMPAEQASDWFLRAMQFLVRSGMDVPPHIFEAGPAGFFAIGIGTALAGLAKSPFHEVKPLLDELKACVETYLPPGGTQELRQWAVISSQIQEATTIFRLYEEVVSLMLGFSLAAEFSIWKERIATMMAEFMRNTETSTGDLPLSSEAGLPH